MTTLLHATHAYYAAIVPLTMHGSSYTMFPVHTSLSALQLRSWSGGEVIDESLIPRGVGLGSRYEYQAVCTPTMVAADVAGAAGASAGTSARVSPGVGNDMACEKNGVDKYDIVGLTRVPLACDDSPYAFLPTNKDDDVAAECSGSAAVSDAGDVNADDYAALEESIAYWLCQDALDGRDDRVLLVASRHHERQALRHGI